MRDDEADGIDLEKELQGAMREVIAEATAGGFSGRNVGKVVREKLRRKVQGMIRSMVEAELEGAFGELIGSAGIGKSAAEAGGGSVFKEALGGLFGGGFGTLLSIAGALSRRTAPEFADVKPIFDDGVFVRKDEDIEKAFGDEAYERAVFSSRNAGGAEMRRIMSARGGTYDAEMEERWVSTSKLNEMAGIPRRTNFNHG